MTHKNKYRYRSNSIKYIDKNKYYSFTKLDDTKNKLDINL